MAMADPFGCAQNFCSWPKVSKEVPFQTITNACERGTRRFNDIDVRVSRDHEDYGWYKHFPASSGYPLIAPKLMDRSKLEGYSQAIDLLTYLKWSKPPQVCATQEHGQCLEKGGQAWPELSNSTVLQTRSVAKWSGTDGGGCHLSFKTCYEYDGDIMKCMREKETVSCVLPMNFLQKGGDPTKEMRAYLINWMVEVGDAHGFDFHSSTVHLAVNYLDHYLANFAVPKIKLQLIGTVAMLLAAKMEEVRVPPLRDFAYITDNTYTVPELCDVEMLMLLSLELAVPTSHGFLEHFAHRCGTDDRVVNLALYLCELALLDRDIVVKFLPSKIAAAALCVAHFQLDKQWGSLWNSHLTTATGYELRNISSCVDSLNAIFITAPISPNQAIVLKYKKARYMEVANVSAAKVLP